MSRGIRKQLKDHQVWRLKSAWAATQSDHSPCSTMEEILFVVRKPLQLILQCNAQMMQNFF